MTPIQKVFSYSLILKLLVSAFIPLFADEAYYWAWSHNLQWSFFDHPPFVAWLFWVGQIFEPFGETVRWPAVLFGHLTGVFWFLGLKKYLSPDSLYLWAILFALHPLTGPGSVIVTPDLPLMFFWSLSFYLMTKLIDTKQLKFAFYLGFSLGLGFLSKYVMVLFFPCALIWLLSERVPMRIIVIWSVALIPGLILASLPVLIWNIQNHWASIAFQLNHGIGSEPYEFEWTRTYILGELFLIFPTVLWLLSQAPRSRKNWELWFFALFPFLFFLITSFKSRPEINWPIIAFPAVLALASSHGLKFKKTLNFTFGFWVVAIILILSQLRYQWLPITKSSESKVFADLAQQVQEINPIYGRSYQMAASISFDLRRQIYKLKGSSRVDAYDFFAQSQPMKGQKFFWISEPNEMLPQDYQKDFVIANRSPLSHNFELVEVDPR